MQEHLTSFTPFDPIMIRIPTLPIDAIKPLFSQSWQSVNSCSDEVALADQLTRDLTDAWASLTFLITESPYASIIQEALQVGSPDLFQSFQKLSSLDIATKRGQRVIINLQRYVLRMTLRCTPFGLFAGVCLGSYGERMNIHVGPITAHKKRTRMDMTWIWSVIRLLEQEEVIADRLTWYVNPCLFFSGKTVMVPYIHTDLLRAHSISLQTSSSIHSILQHAQNGITRAQLKKILNEEKSIEQAKDIIDCFAMLCIEGLLLSELHPHMNTSSYLDPVLTYLSSLKHDASQQAYRQILQKVHAYDVLPIGKGSAVLQELMDTCLADIPTKIEVDYHTSCSSTVISSPIAAEAALLAELLFRLSPTPSISRELQAYASLFTTRYGSEREVPLLELLDDFCGLGPPPGYQSPIRKSVLPLPPRASHTRREHILFELAAMALKEHQREVCLDERLLQKLQEDPDWQSHLPASLDVFIEIAAATQESIEEGAYYICPGVRCGASPSGRSFGRFCDVLEEQATQMLIRLAREEEACEPDILFVELVYLPPNIHSANVALRPSIRHFEIGVDATPGVPRDRVLALNDLVVGVEGDRFYVRSLLHQKKVVICFTHLLNHSSPQTPNVVRFLFEIAGRHTPQMHPFEWGTAELLPFLPRLRYERIILSPAQWHFPLPIDPELFQSFPAWYSFVQQWRGQWDAPRFVLVIENDQKLLLDLENPISILDMRIMCQKQQSTRNFLVLYEHVPGLDEAWVPGDEGRYMIECIVPLQRNIPPDTSHAFLSLHKLPLSVDQDRLCTLGGDWIYIKLYCREEVQNAVLTGPVQTLLTYVSQSLPIRWFFVRYRDPLPHLRLRFQAEPDLLLSHVLPILIAWQQALIQQQWISYTIFDVYEREIERYGGQDAFPLAETVFLYDSQAVLDLLALQNQKSVFSACDIALLSIDYFLRALGIEKERRLQLYQSIVHSQKGAYGQALPQHQHHFHGEYRRFLHMLADPPWLYSQENGELIAYMLQKHARQFQNLKDQLSLLPPHTLSRFLSSQIHMHCNRLLGDRTIEFATMYYLARTLQAFTRHPLEGIQLD